MIAQDRGRLAGRIGLALALAGAAGLGGSIALAQQGPKAGAAKGTAPAGKAQVAAKGADEEPVGQVRMVPIPVNPNDPVAVINNEVITRGQLAEECVARRGEEVLETIINRKLIEQALKARKLEVTAKEIEEEIDRAAETMAGVTREQWLRALAKDRGISPAQYARDIVYPSLALRKLALPEVVVTDQDMKDAYEAQFGEKLRCRIIITSSERHAIEIWNELKKNPASFAKIAQDDQRSVDQATKPFGGQLPEPLTRHAYPRNVSDKAFETLVDGDPNDKDPAHKPKDGDFTGPIQVAKDTWIIVRREGTIPAVQYDPKDPRYAKQIREMLTEAKVKEKMGELMDRFMRGSAIENRITGFMKMANEEKHEDSRFEGKLPAPKTSANPNAAATGTVDAATQPASAPRRVMPSGVSSDDRKAAEAVKQAIQKR